MTTNILAPQYRLAQQAFDFVSPRLTDYLTPIEQAIDMLDLDDDAVDTLKSKVGNILGSAEHAAFMAGFMFRLGLDFVPGFSLGDQHTTEPAKVTKTEADYASVFLSVIKEGLEGGDIYLRKDDDLTTDDSCVGWVDDCINLYPVAAMDYFYGQPEGRRMADLGVSPNAIYRQLKQKSLVRPTLNTSTKVKRDPDSVVRRVLVLKPESLA